MVYSFEICFIESTFNTSTFQIFKINEILWFLVYFDMVRFIRAYFGRVIIIIVHDRIQHTSINCNYLQARFRICFYSSCTSRNQKQWQTNDFWCFHLWSKPIKHTKYIDHVIDGYILSTLFYGDAYFEHLVEIRFKIDCYRFTQRIFHQFKIKLAEMV